jgi:hypothetical protein
MNDDETRVGDAERELAVERLSRAGTDGRLSLAEFSDRVGKALTARTRAELAPLMDDLGAPPVVVPQRSPTRRVWAFIGSTKQRGRWKAAGRIEVRAIMGECKIDLRGAEMAGPELEIIATAIMGNVKIVVPEGAAVEMDGWVFMGSRENATEPDFVDRLRTLMHAPAGQEVAAALAPPILPLIRVTTRVLMGEVKIEHTYS